MPYKKVSEYSCKKLFYKIINQNFNGISINSYSNIDNEIENLKGDKFVAKVDVGEKKER